MNSETHNRPRMRDAVLLLVRSSCVVAMLLVGSRGVHAQCYGPLIPGTGTTYPAGLLTAQSLCGEGCTPCPPFAPGTFSVNWVANATGHAVLQADNSLGGFLTVYEFECVQGQSYVLQLLSSVSGGCTPLGTLCIPGSCTWTSLLNNLDVYQSTPGNCCASPRVISGFGGFPYDTSGYSTGAEGQNDAGCSFSGQTGIEQDMWVEWIAPTTGSAILSLCGTVAGNSKVAVRAGAGCGAPLIGCSDDFCGPQATVQFSVFVGQTYTLQIGNSPGTTGAKGSFGLCVSAATTDCNGNSIPDDCDISMALAPDCNGNNIPDSCDIASGAVDCNLDGIPDSCQSPWLSIVTHPTAALEAESGATVVLTGAAAGFQPIQYQWLRNGVPLVDVGGVSGATTSTLQISPVATSDEGAYVLAASSPCGSVNSNAAQLTIRIGSSFCSGDGFSGVAFSALGLGLWSPIDPAIDVRALTLYDPQDGSGAALIAGGNFTFSGTSLGRIARWTGTSWQPLGASSGANATVRALEVYDRDGPGAVFSPELVAAGDFSLLGTTSAAGIARWNGTTWSALGAGLPGGAVQALATFDPDGPGPQPTYLYAAGSFLFSNSRVARWDGGSWTAVGPPFSSVTNALAVHDDGLGGGSSLYAATNAGLYRLTGSTWTAVGAVGGSISALCSFDRDGTGPLPPTLCLGGSFLSASPVSGAPCIRFAQWNGSSFSGTTEAPDQAVSALRSVPIAGGNVLYVGGLFEFVGSLASPGLARWSGSAWSAYGNSLTNNDLSQSRVNAIQEFDPDAGGPLPSMVHLGGRFDRAGGILVRNVARIEPPPGPSCPCGNWGLTGRGCASSGNPAGAALKATGHPSATQGTVVLTATGVTGPGLFFQGTSQFGAGYGIIYGDGLLCAGGAITRLGVVFPVGSVLTYPGGTTPGPIHIGGGPLAPGDVRHYQCWYRDAAVYCSAGTFNLTQGITLAWLP